MAEKTTTGWETPKAATSNGMPTDLPDVSKVEAKYDGEMYRPPSAPDRKFRFVYSHWVEVKSRAPRTPKNNANAPENAAATAPENAAATAPTQS